MRVKDRETSRVDRFREGRRFHRVCCASQSVKCFALSVQGGPAPKRSMMLARYSRRAAVMVRSAIRHCQGEKRQAERQAEPRVSKSARGLRMKAPLPGGMRSHSGAVFASPRRSRGINVRMSPQCNRLRVSSKSPRSGDRSQQSVRDGKCASPPFGHCDANNWAVARRCRNS